MTDDEVRHSARGIALSWFAEWALMLRADQSEDSRGLDGYEHVVERHITELLTIRAKLAAEWGYPPPPEPFPFPEAVGLAAA